jgi:hypothetical protein
MTPLSVIPCGPEELEWLTQLREGHIEPDDRGWPEFTFPSERSGLRKKWQVAFLRVADELHAVVIARRGDNVGRVGSRFEVQAWRRFEKGVPVAEFGDAGAAIDALARDEPLSEVEEQLLIAVLGAREPWVPETIEEWR